MMYVTALGILVRFHFCSHCNSTMRSRFLIGPIPIYASFCQFVSLKVHLKVIVMTKFIIGFAFGRVTLSRISFKFCRNVKQYVVFYLGMVQISQNRKRTNEFTSLTTLYLPTCAIWVIVAM